MKKLFALFALCLCLTMVVSCDKQETEDTTPSETQETESETQENESMLSDYTEGLAFELRNGSYAVIGYTGDTKDVVIPEKYDGVSVTSIANYAFFNASHLTSVSIPDGITTIGNYAFKGCTALKTFTISDKVEQVGVATFEGCDSLENITVPFLGYNKTAENGTLKYLFGNNIPSSLKTVTVTGGTVLSKEAFSNCNYLTKINLPDTLKVIGEKAFYGCTGLTELVIPANVTDIGENAFNGCTGIEEIIIPAKVLKIGIGAFSNCSALTSVTISDSVQEIERLAFANCTSLTEMVIPDTVQIIGDKIFMGCDALEKITVPFLGNKKSNNSSSTHKILGYFFNYTHPSGTNIYDSINDLSDIPSSLKEVVITLDQMVEDEAFEGCKYLTNITLPSGVKTLGEKAFYGCTSLKNVTFGGSMDDWANITRGALWNRGLDACKIVCSDGEIAAQE